MLKVLRWVKALAKQRSDRSMVAWLILIAIVTHLGWLLSFSVFTSGDWWYISLERYRDFAHFSPIWITEGLGTTSAVPPFYFIRFLEGMATFIGFSFVLTEKLFFFIPIIFGSTLGAYLFLRQYFRPTLAFVGALVFSFNTAMMFNYAGALTIATAYALTPLALFFFRQYLFRPRSRKVLIITALLLAVIAAYEQRIVLLVLAMAFGLFVFNAFWSENRLTYIKQRFMPLAKLLALFVALHAFWLIPYIFNAKSGVTFSDLLSRQLFESFSNVQNALTLYHPFWTGGRPATFVPQPIPLYMWLLPLAAFGGFLLPRQFRLRVKQYREVIYWGIIALIGIFLVKQVNEPFTSVYPWLYDHLPGAAAFREASKFYLLNTLGYAVLIPFTLLATKIWLQTLLADKKHGERALRIMYAGLMIGIVGLSLGQVKPLITGEFRTLYKARSMPADYAIFNAFVQKQPEHFRVLWTPVNSRWGTQSDKHPSVSATQLAQGAWLQSLGAEKEDPFPTMRDKSAGLLAHASSNDMLDRANVKYVVVPLRDTANEDDFIRKYGDDRQFYAEQLNNAHYLKKIDIGTRDLLVYENASYQPYVDAFDSLQTTNIEKNNDSFPRFYQVVKEQLAQVFNFVIPGNSSKSEQAVYPSTTVNDVFQNLKPADIQSDKIQKAVKGSPKTNLYLQGNNRRITYEIRNNTITFFSQTDNNLEIDGSRIAPAGRKTELAEAELKLGASYILSLDGKPSDFAAVDGTRDLGIVNGPLALYEARANTLPNPSFEEGLWQKHVADCNNYDNNPVIGMRPDTYSFRDGQTSLQFETWKHTACTDSAPVPITAKDYLLTFDYRIVSGNAIGYEVHFNDPAKTVIKKTFDTKRTSWQNYSAFVSAPPNASSYTVRLLGYSDYLLRGSSLTSYDNVRMIALASQAQIANNTPAYQKIPITKQAATITHPIPTGSSSKNLVSNSGFDQELWHKKVGNCNRYDESPIIGMKQVNRGKNDKAIELSARRHAACTSQSNIPAKEFHVYLLSFDYQSPNAQNAHYRVEFNDPKQTTLEGQAKIKGKGWQSFATPIQAPAGATSMKVTILAFEGNYKIQTIINRYDNVALREIPLVTGQYYVASEPSEKLAEPKKITFQDKSATTKHITIDNAAAPFYIGMSESYNPLWRLALNDQRGLRSWFPWNKPQGADSLKHFKLNDFANGWYVDPSKLCAAKSSSCEKQADGSYDIKLVAEYAAQRWFNVGAIISVITLLGCIGYLTYGWKKVRNTRKK